jgi:hypothetical protein
MMHWLGLFSVLSLTPLPAGVLLPVSAARLCGRDATVSFSGVANAANAPISLAAASSVNGHYRVFASTTSAKSPDHHGAYTWSVSAVVPNWQLGSSYAHSLADDQVFVRAYQGSKTSAIELSVSVAKEGFTLCHRTRDGGLEPADQCTKASAGPLSLSAPHISSCSCATPFEVFGDLTIDTDAEALLNRCVQVVHGNFSVLSGVTLSDGIGFPLLAAVEGDAHLEYTVAANSNAYRHIVAPAWTDVTGSLSLSVTYVPGIAETTDLGLPNLANLGQDLDLSLHVTNLTFGGLDALSEVLGNVHVFSNSESGQVLGHVQHVSGNVVYESNGVGLYSFMNALEQIDGSLHITLPSSASIVHGLDLLTQVNGDWLLQGYIGNKLAPLLSVIGGTLEIQGDPTPKPHVGAAALSVSHLSVHDNPGLNTVGSAGTGLSNLQLTPTGSISFHCNPSLSTAQTDVFVAAQQAAGFVGSVSASPACP